jgi:hypothetical protein
LHDLDKLYDKYFRTLQLSPGASESEIKRAYRKLAMQFHPDRNSNPGAAERFIQLTEAYEILTHQRALPNSSLSKRNSASTNSETAQQEQEERMRAARERFARKQMEEELENERYYHRITREKPYRFFIRVMQLCVLSSMLLVADYIIPGKVEEASVLRYTIGAGTGGMMKNKVFGIELETSERIWLEQSARASLVKNPRIRLERSRIFGEIKRLAVREQNTYHTLSMDFSLFGTFPIVPLLFLIPFVGWLLKGRNLAYSLLFHSTLYLFFPGIILFYLLHGRIIHLLSFNWF